MAVRAAGSLCVHLARTQRLRDPAAGRAQAGRDRPRHGRVAGRARAPGAGRGGPAARRRDARAREAGRCSGSRPPTCGARRARLERLPAGGALRGRRRARPTGAAAVFEVAGCTRLPARPRRAGGWRRERAIGAEPLALPARRGRRRPRAPSGDSLPLRLATFTALAAFGAAHWAGLVVDAPGGPHAPGARRGGAPAPWRSRCSAARRSRAAPCSRAAALVTLATLLLALDGRPGSRCGCSARAAGASSGTGSTAASRASRAIDWPYGGPDEWVRLTILLGAPLLLARRGRARLLPGAPRGPRLRMARSSLLLVLYGTAVTEHDPGAPLLRGLVLLVLVGAWLWLPRLAGARRSPAAGRGGRRGPPGRARGRVASTPSIRGGTTATGTCSATAARSPSTGPTRTARSTGPATARRCSTSSPTGRTTGRSRRSTASTASAGCAPTTAAPSRRTCPGSPRRGSPRAGAGTTSSTTRAGTSSSGSPCARSRATSIVGAGITYGVDGAGAAFSSQRRHHGPHRASRRSSAATPTPCGPTRPIRRRRRCAGRPGDSAVSLLQYTDVLLPAAGRERPRPGRRPRPASTAGPSVQVPLRDCRTRPPTRRHARARDSRYARTYRLASRITARRSPPPTTP